MPYLLDADVFIRANRDHYSMDLVPAFWDWLLKANQDGLVFSVEQVKRELRTVADELADWADERGGEFFLAPDAATVASLKTVSAWASNANYDRAAVSEFLDSADYWLIAHAGAIRTRPVRSVEQSFLRAEASSIKPYMRFRATRAGT